MRFKFLFHFIFLLLFVSCNQQDAEKSASEIFGVVEAEEKADPPNVKINLLTVNPANSYLGINKTKQFYATGGKAPYTFTVNSGGGTLNASNLYTAPSFASNVVIKVEDSEGNIAYGTISVNVPIAMTPASINIGIGGNATFTAAGGIPPYTYSIVSGNGTVNSVTGVFDATAIPAGTSIIRATDNAGNSAFSSITIDPTLAISPITINLGKNDTQTFTASGGQLPYTFSVLAGGGSIGSSSGVFTAPNSLGAITVRVTDNVGTTSDATISIVDKPILSVNKTNLAINTNITFTTTLGTSPYTYSVVSGGGSIDSSTGVFSSATPGTNVVRVTDNAGFFDEKSIEVFLTKKVAAGIYHTCVMNPTSLTSSETKCWGKLRESDSYHHQAGYQKINVIGDESDEKGDYIPRVRLGTGVFAKGLVVGPYTTCVITTLDDLKCWGNNSYGELFRGNNVYLGSSFGQMGDSLFNVDLGTNRKIKNTISPEDAVTIGNQTVCAILDNDDLKCWGYGGYGNRASETNTHYGNSAGHTGDSLTPVNIGADIPVQVHLGTYGGCVRFSDGSIKCWGLNSSTNGATKYGQLGVGSNTITRYGDGAGESIAAQSAVSLGTGRTAVKVIYSLYHACALLDDNSLKCWGEASRIGQENTSPHVGINVADMGDNLATVNLGSGVTVSDIASGVDAICALLNTGEVKCFGVNTRGELGQGSTQTLGDGANEMGDFLPAVDLGVGRTATAIFGGYYNFCVKLDNNDVKCWGRNDHAQLMQGHKYDVGKSPFSMGDNLPALDMGSGNTISKIGVGMRHGCALLTDNTVKCWGTNHNGSRGVEKSIIGDQAGEIPSQLASVDPGQGEYFVSIKGYSYFSCGLTNNNRLVCWGNNGYGRLGYGPTPNGQGGYLDTYGDNMKKVELGTGLYPIDYDVGDYHACAVLNNNKLKCWGYAQYGKLGNGTASGGIGDSILEIGDNMPNVDLGTVGNPVKVSVGYYNTCVLFDNNGIKCWGYGADGRNGSGSAATLGDGAGEMGDNLNFINLNGDIPIDLCVSNPASCIITSTNKVKCWGHSQYIGGGFGSTNDQGDNAGEMAALPYLDFGSNFTPTKLTCGAAHICALSDSGAVKCWGNGANGRLGNGSTTVIGDHASEMGDALVSVSLGTGRTAVDIDAGYYHTCAVLDNNKIKCWGHNFYGQLGHGHVIDVGTSLLHMGDSLPYTEVE